MRARMAMTVLDQVTSREQISPEERAFQDGIKATGWPWPSTRDGDVHES